MVTCSLLAFLIVSLFAVSNSPFSAAPESNLDVLFEKTVNVSTAAITGAEPAFQSFETDSQNVSQLIEVRQYRDGMIEKDYVETSFKPLDENGLPSLLSTDDYLFEKPIGRI